VEYSRRSSYIKVDDVRDGPIGGTIAHVKEGKFGRPDVTLESGKVISLNGSNTETLIDAYGADSDVWIGRQIELYLGSIRYQNEDNEAVLVKPVTPPIKPVKQKKITADDDEAAFDDPIPY
jgi:hypothetical protein